MVCILEYHVQSLQRSNSQPLIPTGYLPAIGTDYFQPNENFKWVKFDEFDFLITAMQHFRDCQS